MPKQPEMHGMPPALATPTDLGANAARDIAAALNGLLADVFALYLKTKNFHWHMSGPHFRDLMLDDQSDQIFAMTDVLAGRVRKVGTLRYIPSARYRAISGSPTTDAPYVTPQDMLAELREDNGVLAKRLREAHGMIDEHNDVATASLLEVVIDESVPQRNGRSSAWTRTVREAARKMGAGPPGSAFRSRSQTSPSCCGKEPWW